MTGCIYKLGDGRCDKPGRYKSPCIGEACTHQTPTNADRIRAMSDEKLANEIIKIVAFCAPGHRSSPVCCCDCRTCWLDWLKSPVKPGEVDDGNI